MVITYYRQLYRRVNRLPLDNSSINYLRLKIRSRFNDTKIVPTKHILDRNKYDHAIKVMDSILQKNKLLSFDELLDLVYKFDEPTPSWINDLYHTKYNSFKRLWPQVHLIDEFGDPNHRKAYYIELKKQEPLTEFLIMEELGLQDQPGFHPLIPIRQEKALSNLVNTIFNKLYEFYRFLDQHSGTLVKDVKLQRFEIFYKPNAYGYPISVEEREKTMRKKINYMKGLVSTYTPLRHECLQRLVLFTQNELLQVNPNYYRYMIRKIENEIKEQSVSFYERKYVRDKQLIPDARLIRFYYKGYAIRQFSRGEDGNYSVSPIKSIYN